VLLTHLSARFTYHECGACQVEGSQLQASEEGHDRSRGSRGDQKE